MRLRETDLRCPECRNRAERVTGRVLYPHRPDLAASIFWRCPFGCDCYAGTHKNGSPKAQLANRETRQARIRAHGLFDRLWKELGWARAECYAALARNMGQTEVHIGWMSAEECRKVEEWAEANAKRLLSTRTAGYRGRQHRPEDHQAARPGQAEEGIVKMMKIPVKRAMKVVLSPGVATDLAKMQPPAPIIISRPTDAEAVFKELLLRAEEHVEDMEQFEEQYCICESGDPEVGLPASRCSYHVLQEAIADAKAGHVGHAASMSDGEPCPKCSTVCPRCKGRCVDPEPDPEFGAHDCSKCGGHGRIALATPAPKPGEVTDWEQRVKDAEAALWCIAVHGYTTEDHAHMTCDCASRTQAMLDKIYRVAYGLDPTAPASAKGEEKP